ncbi:hypothetical protein HUJ04_001081 [Dendroctonus ponderosae]|uniref:Odorant receptor n=2 Tax=Dendroctonus ponderosae TaxID=77166 RepID=A0AAR5Q4P3_DENPD|nr:hypothetical protein HUJ04_001081 [Dendroctonus ponderosae]
MCLPCTMKCRFVKDFNENVRSLILIEFLISSVNIACVAFQLISANRIADDIFTPCFLLVLFGQLLVLAWPANEMSMESLGVSIAIYDFPWYQKNIAIQNMARVVLLRAQTPLRLTIGLFNPLTTDTVIKVLNGAYSYVTIMTNNKEEA